MITRSQKSNGSTNERFYLQTREQVTRLDILMSFINQDKFTHFSWSCVIKPPARFIIILHQNLIISTIVRARFPSANSPKPFNSTTWIQTVHINELYSNKKKNICWNIYRNLVNQLHYLSALCITLPKPRSVFTLFILNRFFSVFKIAMCDSLAPLDSALLTHSI